MPGLGRGPVPPGRGMPGPAGRGGRPVDPVPGRGAPGRGAGAPPPTPKGLFPTRGPGRGPPGRGAIGPAPGGADAAGGGVTAGPTVGAGGASMVGAGAVTTTGSGRGVGVCTAAGAGVDALAGAVALAAGTETWGNASRNRRATGASTVDEALLTNSPSSLSLARTSLLETLSSLASSCTRALPATGLLRGGRAASRAAGVSRGTCSSLALHRVPIAIHCSLRMPGRGSPDAVVRSEPPETYSRTALRSSGPATRSARANDRRRSASATQPGS
jgi:hypothetical protein